MKNQTAVMDSTAVLGSVPRARSPEAAAMAPGWHPDDVLAGQLARNAGTWAILLRLGVCDGAELPLAFCFETGGDEADRELAEHLESLGHSVAIERDGVSGSTGPMRLSPAELDEWVQSMVWHGYLHGGCRFAGWTATVSR